MADKAPPGFFETRPERYEALVDWQRRLANETPFYRALFEQIDARTVLDVACGTGHHAALFHSWGLRVEGADVSREMLDRCRANFAESASLRWVERPFEQPHPTGRFDAVICVGNSLAIVDDLPVAERVIAAMLAALRPGGVCVVQVLNLWRFPQGPTTWQKCVRIRDNQTDCILLKGVHRIAAHGYVEMVELTLTATGVDRRCDSATLRAFEADELRAAAEKGGGTSVRCHGDYHNAPYERDKSQDVILVCRRA